MISKKQQRKAAPKLVVTKRQKLGLVGGDASIKDIKRSLKLGQDAADRHDWPVAVKHLLVAWDAMPEDLAVLTILAHALVQLGVREHAISVLQRALEVHEPTADLIGIIQRLALEMGMYEIAVKLGIQLVALAPESSASYVNLATAYSGVKQYDESIDMLQSALPLMPAEASLWNVLATQVRERDGVDAADVFFEEAMRLDPDNAQIISNYSISYTRRNQLDKALELALKSIAINPDSPEPRIGAAQFLFLKGEMKEAWEHYGFRLDLRRKSSQTHHYTHKLPEWQGQDLIGKSIFVTAEQGIGDEVMWGSYLPFLYETAEKLYIGCDPRLVSIYKRRFPKAIVGSYLDRIVSGYRYRVFPGIEKMMSDGGESIDYYVPVGSAARFAWRTSDDIRPHQEGYLFADPVRSDEFKKRIMAMSGKPKVGLAWRSGIVSSERSYLYADIDSLGPLMALSEYVDFINLQYGDVADELAAFKSKFGVTVRQFDDVDLKADIEANLAIMSQCDLVISSCSAPGMFAMSSGRPTLLMAGAPPWWCFGSKSHAPFANDAEVFFDAENNDWDDIIGRVTRRATEKLGL